MKIGKPLLAGAVALGLATSLAGCARPSIAAAAKRRAQDKLIVRAQAAEQPAKADDTSDRFAFAADKGGQALRGLLPPADKLATPLADRPPGPRDLKSPVDVARPSVPLAPNQGDLLRPPLPKAPLLRPHMLAENAPFTAYRGDPLTPTTRDLDTGARVALPVRDPNQPAALGLLGLPVPDRVPLDDPTTEASLQAALAAVPPQRTDPVPFAPQNLPDPFQNAQTVKLRTPPTEEPTPSPFVGSKAPPPPPPPAPPAKQ